jgi:CheY-like chemotaxis protein
MESYAGHSILVVDDDEICLDVMKRYFKLFGVGNVMTVQNGQSAIDYLRDASAQIDLVILDIGLPGIDGYQVCQSIRNDLHLPSMPIIGMTAYSLHEGYVRAKASGINELLSKPCTPVILKQIMVKYLPLLDVQ